MGGAAETGGEKLGVRAPVFERILQAGFAHFVIVGHEDFAAAEGAKPAELARFFEHDDGSATVVRDDGGAERAQAGAYGDEVGFQIPTLRSASHVFLVRAGARARRQNVEASVS